MGRGAEVIDGGNDFLREWAPWRALATGRRTQQVAQREPQYSMKD